MASCVDWETKLRSSVTNKRRLFDSYSSNSFQYFYAFQDISVILHCKTTFINRLTFRNFKTSFIYSLINSETFAIDMAIFYSCCLESPLKCLLDRRISEGYIRCLNWLNRFSSIELNCRKNNIQSAKLEHISSQSGLNIVR